MSWVLWWQITLWGAFALFGVLWVITTVFAARRK